jgi:hypothetical protein
MVLEEILPRILPYPFSVALALWFKWIARFELEKAIWIFVLTRRPQSLSTNLPEYRK